MVPIPFSAFLLCAASLHCCMTQFGSSIGEMGSPFPWACQVLALPSIYRVTLGKPLTNPGLQFPCIKQKGCVQSLRSLLVQTICGYKSPFGFATLFYGIFLVPTIYSLVSYKNYLFLELSFVDGEFSHLAPWALFTATFQEGG